MNIGIPAYDVPIDDKGFATVELIKPVLVHTTNFAPGQRVTVDIPRAREMIACGAARWAKFDPSAVPPVSLGRRPYLANDAAIPAISEEAARNAYLAANFSTRPK